MIGRHKFASGIVDSADTALVLASDWNADVLLGYVLTNRTGGVLNEGDVVAIDSANDKSVILADTAGARRQYVVFVSAVPSSSVHTPGTSINNLETGIFLPVGIANKIKVAGATTRGNYLRKSATAQALEDTSVAVGSAPPGDAIATAFTSTGGAGTVAGIFLGVPISPGGNLKSVQVFTGSGTWNRPAGIRRVIAEVVGAGGGGGGVTNTDGNNFVGAGGGGGGGYSMKLIDVSAIASSTITVGAAGAGGAAGNNAGAAGGSSSWADGTNTVTGNGGGGGGGGPAGNGGAMGTAAGGTFDLNGQGGGSGHNATTNTVSAHSGAGGTSRFGGGGPGVGGGTSAAGNSGGQYGGGGGGAHNGPAQGVGRAGGTGGPGLVVVWEFE